MTQEQLTLLRTTRFLRNTGEVDMFEATLAQIYRQGTVRQAEIEELYLLFEDASDQLDVQWGLLHMIEDFSLDVLLSAFVAVLPRVVAKSLDWAETITSRFLNSDETRQALRALLRDTPEARRAVLPILHDLSRVESPRLQQLRRHAEEVLKDIQT